jgi:hypothetical protein
MASDRARSAVRSGVVAVWIVAALGLAGCSGSSSSEADEATTTSSTVAESDSTSSTVAPGVAELVDGPITPGRYRYVIESTCDDKLVDCDAGVPAPPGLFADVTVPDGWEASLEFHLIAPRSANATAGPDGAGLVLGWTTGWVGLNSEPCAPIGTPGGHQVPDIPVGPTVDDFVDAVVAHPALEVTQPKDVTLGGRRGRFFTLTGPSHVRDCDGWRPWDPGFYAQGPNNQWDVWVMDVDGFRVVVVAQHFPDTPTEVATQLQEMVESIELGA